VVLRRGIDFRFPITSAAIDDHNLDRSFLNRHCLRETRVQIGSIPGV
jgi:hypothetical protein